MWIQLTVWRLIYSVIAHVVELLQISFWTKIYFTKNLWNVSVSLFKELFFCFVFCPPIMPSHALQSHITEIQKFNLFITLYPELSNEIEICRISELQHVRFNWVWVWGSVFAWLYKRETKMKLSGGKFWQELNYLTSCAHRQASFISHTHCPFWHSYKHKDTIKAASIWYTGSQ